MSLKKLRDLLEIPVLIFGAAGVITAVFDITIRGFSPVIWFMISFWFVLIIICMEVSMIREHLEKEPE